MSKAVVGKKYRHYKSDEKTYEVVSITDESTNGLIPTVNYKQLYSSPEYPEGTLWSRLRSEFEGQVTQDNSFVVDRFTLLE